MSEWDERYSVKFNLELLKKELGSLIVGGKIESNSSKPMIEYALLYSNAERQFDDAVLYVALADQFTEKDIEFESKFGDSEQLFSCVCIGAPPDRLLGLENVDVIWTETHVDQIELFNMIQQVFHKYTSWEQRLDAIISRGGTLADLTMESIPVFKNDICITDVAGKVLVYRLYQSRFIDKELTDLIKEQEYLPRNMVQDSIDDDIEGRFINLEEPVFSRMRAFDTEVIRCGILLPSDSTLVVSIHSNFKQVDQADFAILTAFVEAIKRLYRLHFSSQMQRNRDTVDIALKSYLIGNYVGTAELARCAAALGWDKDSDRYVCICAEMHPQLVKEIHFTKPLVLVCNKMQDIFSGPVFILEGRIVVLINLSKNSQSIQQCLDLVNKFAEEYNLVAGASLAYVGMRTLPGCYQQALSALTSIKSSADPATYLVSFEEVTTQVGIGFIADEIYPEFFCPKKLMYLAKHEPELYETLKVFLASNCNANAASKTLFLQRNSLIYRLEKIKKLTDFDLDDSDTRLLLLTSFKIFELYDLGATL